MMPIKYIRQKLVVEAEVIDVEAIGARLEHHGVGLRVDNQFSSDCGHNWHCLLIIYEHRLDAHCETLRKAILDVLDQLVASDTINVQT